MRSDPLLQASGSPLRPPPSKTAHSRLDFTVASAFVASHPASSPDRGPPPPLGRLFCRCSTRRHCLPLFYRRGFPSETHSWVDPEGGDDDDWYRNRPPSPWRSRLRKLSQNPLCRRTVARTVNWMGNVWMGFHPGQASPDAGKGTSGKEPRGVHTAETVGPTI